eukprot:15478754-Alexandrium_andersonii.AAC.1
MPAVLASLHALGRRDVEMVERRAAKWLQSLSDPPQQLAAGLQEDDEVNALFKQLRDVPDVVLHLLEVVAEEGIGVPGEALDAPAVLLPR